MLDPADVEALEKLSNDASSLNSLDRDQVKRLRSHVSSKLKREKRNIEALEAQLHKARDSRKCLSKQFLLLHRAVISWADLPAEILAQIFRHLKGTVHFPVRRSDFTWIIAQVCSRWRDVVREEQTLWTDVHLTFALNQQHQLAQEVMVDLLQRSGFREVSLTLDCDEIPWNNPKVSIPFFTEIVRHAACRPTSLTLLDMDHNVLDELYLVFEQLSLPLFPKVRNLEVTPTIYDRRIPDAVAGDHRCPVAELIIRMPSVTGLIMNAERRDDRPSSLIGHSFSEWQHYPWDRLEDIQLLKYELSIEPALFLLSKTRALRSIKLQICGRSDWVDYHWNPEPETEQLSFLEELDVVFDIDTILPGGYAIVKLFTPLQLPQLRTLRISSIKYRNEYESLYMTDEADGTRYLCRFKTLTSLILDGCMFVDIHLLLEGLPGLQHLAVHPRDCNELSRQSMAALALKRCGLNLRSLHCCIAKGDVDMFISLLVKQWFESKSTAASAGPGACLHDARITVGCDRQTLASSNVIIKNIKKQLGVDFKAEFLPLCIHILDTDSDDDHDHSSQF